MKLFKDLLSEASQEDVINKILGLDAVAEEVEDYKKFFEALDKIKPLETGHILIAFDFEEVDGEKEVELFYKDNIDSILIKESPINELSLDEIDDLSGNAALEFLEDKVVPTPVGYEYNPWDEILGYEVDEENVKAFGLVDFIATVVSKMTFFGTTEEEVASVREVMQEGLALQETTELMQMKIKGDDVGAHSLLVGFGTRDTSEDKELAKIKSVKKTLKITKIELNIFNKIK